MIANHLTSKYTREYYIDVLKGVAMLAVVLVHLIMDGVHLICY